MGCATTHTHTPDNRGQRSNDLLIYDLITLGGSQWLKYFDSSELP